MALLPDIEAFLERNAMAPTKLGDAALGDRHFVRQLRAGRRVWPETEAKVRSFMEGYSTPVICTTCDLRTDSLDALSCGTLNCPRRLAALTDANRLALKSMAA